MPLKVCPLSFIKEALSGDLSVFQNHEIVPVNAPRYKELTVDKFLRWYNKYQRSCGTCPQIATARSPGSSSLM